MRMVLIGFMGVGKTTVGKKIAEKLNINFVDMDSEIEKKEGQTISKIFEERGEEYFRRVETKILKELLKKENIVISTGGGIVTVEENINILKKEKNIIFLDANTKTIIEHLSNEIDKRPLLKNSSNLYKTISELLDKRSQKYNDACKLKIDVNEKNVDEVVSQILVYIN